MGVNAGAAVVGGIRVKQKLPAYARIAREAWQEGPTAKQAYRDSGVCLVYVEGTWRRLRECVIESARDVHYTPYGAWLVFSICISEGSLMIACNL